MPYVFNPFTGTFDYYQTSGGGSSPLTTKGDIYVYSTTNARLPVGTDGQVLSADSTQTTGLKWITASGTGSVTSVSVVTANGISGSVSNPTTTPAITLTLGAITPTTVNGVTLSGSSTPSLAVTGSSSIAGSNTGDQTITLTSDVTGSGTASFATTIKSSVNLSGNPTTTTQSASDNSTKIATTAYVTTGINNAISGINPAVAVQAATTAAGDTSALTYNNGVSGVGATLTGANNTALTIDGFTFTTIGQRLLVKNDTQSPSGAFNGIYYVTQVQALALPLILTRALDYDMPSDMNNTGAIPVVNGTANANTSWLLTSTVNTVGTDPLTYTQFSLNPTSIVTLTGMQTLTNKTLTSPTLTTPSLGVATATSINGLTISTSTGTLTVANGKTITANNSITLAGTDSTTMTFPTTNATIARTDAAQTFTGVQTFSTPIAVGSGGTGNSSLTAHALLIGEGSSATADTGAGTKGQHVVSQGASADPAWKTYGIQQTITPASAVTNSSAQTTVISGGAITGGWPAVVNVGDTIRVRIGGPYTNNTGANQTLGLFVLFGATTIFSQTSAALTASATARLWVIDITLVALVISGSVGQFQAFGNAGISGLTGGAADIIDSGSVLSATWAVGGGITAASLANNAAANLDVQLKMSTATSGGSFQANGGIIEAWPKLT